MCKDFITISNSSCSLPEIFSYSKNYPYDLLYINYYIFDLIPNNSNLMIYNPITIRLASTQSLFIQIRGVSRLFSMGVHIFFVLNLPLKYAFLRYALPVQYAIFSRKTLCLKCFFFLSRKKHFKHRVFWPNIA